MLELNWSFKWIYYLSEKDIYWELMRLRKQICLARLGFSWSDSISVAHRLTDIACEHRYCCKKERILSIMEIEGEKTLMVCNTYMQNSQHSAKQCTSFTLTIEQPALLHQGWECVMLHSIQWINAGCVPLVEMSTC